MEGEVLRKRKGRGVIREMRGLKYDQNGLVANVLVSIFCIIIHVNEM